eukprot:765985-Hanusia_phi.AAC.1
MDLEDQPSFRDVGMSSDDLSDLAEEEAAGFRALSEIMRKSWIQQEEHRHATYGCPSRQKQLQALRYSLMLLASPRRSDLVSATGEKLLL